MGSVPAAPEPLDAVEAGCTLPSEEEDSLSAVHVNDARGSQVPPVRSGTWVIATLIVVFGVVACVSIIAFGVISLENEQTHQFQRIADEVVAHIENAFVDYKSAGLWVHSACLDRNISRVGFRELYEHVTADGLQVLGANMIYNVTDDERPAFEEEARNYYAEFHPDIAYRGFVGMEPNISSETGYSVQPRSRQPFYYVVHLIAPVEENAKAADFDLWSSETRQETIRTALDTWQPALTERLVVVQETEGTYSVVLMHPGTPLSTRPNVTAQDVSNIVIRIPDLLDRATSSISYPVSVYLYDSTYDRSNTDDFLGGVMIGGHENVTKAFMPEVELSTLLSSRQKRIERIMEVTNKRWTVTVMSINDEYKANNSFVLLGGIITLLACICIALWVLSNSRRISKISQMKAAAEAEKTALIIENAKTAATIERDLNDWIAHEVRNPVAAAMSACSFVKSALAEKRPLKDEKSVQSAREDIHIIDNSLQFINDLLRNMLDMHRVSSNQLKIVMKPTDIILDVFEPVDSMLYRRGSKYELIIDCPENLIVMTDRLRLKQIILNLARNSSKFLSCGFIRLRASIIDGKVVLFVEDSGTGIPREKRPFLFTKFQETLDSLSQGTGIGLSLCKNLIELMGGQLWLDESFDSGVEGSPGTRFVVELETPPLQFEPNTDGLAVDSTASGTESSADETVRSELPSSLSVLFVDDDLVLRKLFARSVKKVLPEWRVREVSNGETAIRLCATESFDLIFMDQYMASVEKQLLGTETVQALRMNGFEKRICGLSANNVEEQFLQAGADAFMYKPFPCDGPALLRELHRILIRKEPVDYGLPADDGDC